MRITKYRPTVPGERPDLQHVSTYSDLERDAIKHVREAYEAGRRAGLEAAARMADAVAGEMQPCAEAIGARRAASRIRGAQ